MIIIPAIYLSNGNAVSWYKGERDQQTVLSRDPLASARGFEKKGAKIIHLVDVDKTDGGHHQNRKIAEIIAKNTKLNVWYADSVNSIQEIEYLLKLGINRISLNQFSEDLVKEAVQKFGAQKILFTIRAQRNVIEGRPGLEVFHYGKDLQDLGITDIVFRDIKAEGTFHPNFDEIERLKLGCNANIFAFGGIGTEDDLEILRRTGAHGAIISRAFFERKLSHSL